MMDFEAVNMGLDSKGVMTGSILSGRAETPLGDYKSGLKYKFNALTGEFEWIKEVGGGIPFLEAKVISSSSKKIEKIGIQEEFGLSFAKNSFKFSFNLQFVQKTNK